MAKVSEKTTVRISKKSLAAFPASVSEAIRSIQAGHPNIKSFSYAVVTPDHKFYTGEGYQYTVVYGDDSNHVEMVAEHNIGSSNVSHRIGETFTCKVGAFVLLVSYYTKYFLDIYNVQETPLGDVSQKAIAAPASEPSQQDAETPAVDETPEPAADSDRPTVTEARLIETITELHMAVQRAENEAASLRGQLDALKVRYAEMEAENANINADAENMSAHIVRLEKARDYWRQRYSQSTVKWRGNLSTAEYDQE